jgi:hypothetical protein
MSEIISCPSCQRKVQVPETLAGQDVQCPTCGATFVANLPGTPARSQAPQDNWGTTERPSSWSEQPPPDYGQRGYDQPPRGYDQPPRGYGQAPPVDYGGYGASRGFGRRDVLPHRGGLILALGLIGVTVCGFVAPFAWVMGNTDLAEIRSGRMDRDGEGMTRAGQILGIIGTILLVLSFCFGALFFMSIIGAAGSRGGRGGGY